MAHCHCCEEKDEKKRDFTLIFLALSLAALIISFFHLIPAYIIPVNIVFLNIREFTLDIAWIAILLCGFPIVRGAIAGLVDGFDIKTGLLVSVAMAASVIIGETFAAGEIAFIMAIGAYLEQRTVAKAKAGIEKLVHLTPSTARVVRNGEEMIIPADDVRIGDTLRVLAGETIAVDGVIICGQTSVDQSIVTGESLPVDKGAGDEVRSGTINQFGTFDMTAQKTGDDSSIQRMIRLVESADAGKAKIVGIADKWATWIVSFAIAAALITGFVSGEIIRAVTILVVFCPCALVLATPTAIMAGIGNATKYGILISRGDALERLADVVRVAFDKTGTLTFGKPSVMAVVSCNPAVSEKDLLDMTASAELRSEHPLGKAIAAHYKQACKENPAQPDNFKLIAGRGVCATVNGQTIFAGNEALLSDNRLSLAEQDLRKVAEAKDSGCTVIYVMNDKEPLGFIALSDTLRPDAADTVKAIHATGTKTVLLTGDTAQSAKQIAARAGIADMKAACLPEDKLNTIRLYQSQNEPVCMVGDGINDAPALKAAQVGIAMGGVGSGIAIEAADIVLVGDDIKTLPHLLLLSKKVMRTININLAAAMLLNFAAILLAITGILNPVMGALVHNVGSVAVVTNSSLLLKWRKEF